MRVVGCQLDIAWEDKEANFGRVRALLGRDQPPAGSLIVLPEMFATGFSMDVGLTAEPPGGPTSRFLAELARERQCFVLGGLVERDGAGHARNLALGFDPQGREFHRQAKLHPFGLAGETAWCAPGQSIATFAWQGAVAASFICYDLRFPEVFRVASARGASILVVLANWPEAREAHWLALLRARAIENQAYVVAVNRCGRDPHLAYGGRSLVVDARGEIVADTGRREGCLVTELDLPGLAAYRREFPALADLRRDLWSLGPAENHLRG